VWPDPWIDSAPLSAMKLSPARSLQSACRLIGLVGSQTADRHHNWCCAAVGGWMSLGSTPLDPVLT